MSRGSQTQYVPHIGLPHSMPVTSETTVNQAPTPAQLAATAQGLSMHPLSQALQEYPEQAAHYQAVHQLLSAADRGQTVQMWTRLGHAPAIGPAPRRGLEAHLSV